ncbi:rhomboid family intramembrane serine protease [Maritimibacter sp. 55A14]|uniref:rhomboid family intramembrane serine protease n=1 Tax=Maritimibacter sp. 55A14 TaxID=2174844 RepID=UPI000D6184F4|nr:rhomboid family intramembrane serine protease [Maritimibacter sp. 55A14]PWE31149.1 rhomboid family intramembrane serine protease [Maritimibacter sp. 55A14]
MFQPDHNASPLNPLPWAVSFLALLVTGIELLFGAGERGFIGGPEAVGWRLTAIRDWGVIDPVFDWMVQTGQFPPSELARLLTYPLIHAGFTHALFVVVFILALGKMVGEIFSPAALLSVFFGSAVFGALAYVLLLDERTPLVGGYPGVYGLIGAFSYILWMNLSATGHNRYRAFTLIAVLLGIQLVFGLIFGGGNDWVADFAGFVMGFFMSFVVSPGGVQRMRDWVARARQR